MAEPKTFMKYFFFIFVFIVSFFLMETNTVETFGLILFFVVNMIFCTVIGKDLTDGSVSYNEDNTEQNIKFWILLCSLVFSSVSSIMMMMTIVTLQTKFAEKHSAIRWDAFHRQNISDTETIFIAVTTFIGVVALYVYNTAEDVQKNTSFIFDSILNSSLADWLRVTFPIVIIALGSALYGVLENLSNPDKSKQKTPKCDPTRDIHEFKITFIKTYWILFAFVAVILLRPVIEANFSFPNIPKISTGMLVGFTPEDRSLVFGNNPAISLGSLLTFGIYYLFKNDPNIASVFDIWATVLSIPLLAAWFGIIYVIGKEFDVYDSAIYSLITVLGVSVISYFIYCLIRTSGGVLNRLLAFLTTPIIRWDTIYILLKYGFASAGLVFAAFTINIFKDIPAENICLSGGTYIRELYIVFIFFLIVFYAFNTLSASIITNAVTGTMRYLVPPSLIGLSIYLIYNSNRLMKLAPQIIID